jgi:ABC-type Fe3+ transport system permease subunit
VTGTICGEMLKFYVQHFRQEILLLGVGLGLVLLFVLAYLPLKRSRRPELYQSEDHPEPETWAEAWSFIPWALVVVCVGLFAFVIITVVLKSMHPPNY